MRILLTILLVLTFGVGFGQYTVPRGYPILNTAPYYNFAKPGGFVLFDSLIMMKSGDTLMKPLYPGLKYAYGGWWSWDLTKWSQIRASDTTTQGLQDVITRDNVLTKGDTILSGGHTLRFFGAHEYQFRPQAQFQLWHTDSDATPTQSATFFVFKNDSTETPFSYLGAQISGSAAGGAIQFFNNTEDDETKKLRIGIIDNNNVFDNMMEFHYSGFLGNKIIAPMTESARIGSVMIQQGDTLFKTSLQHLADSLAPYISGDTILPVTWEMTLNNQGSTRFAASHDVNVGGHSFKMDSLSTIGFVIGGDVYSSPNSTFFGSTGSFDWRMVQFDSTFVENNTIEAVLYGGMILATPIVSLGLGTGGEGAGGVRLISDSLFIASAGFLGASNGDVLTLSDNVTGKVGWTTPSSGTAYVWPISYFTPTTGGTVTAVAGANIIEPAGTLATLTVNVPTTPANGTICSFTFVTAITALTFANGTFANTVTSSNAGGTVAFIYRTSNTKWYKWE